jgi:hypothetical protein
MKCSLTTALCLVGTVLLAQPVYEHTFSESATIAYLEHLGEVYYSMDVINKQCLIYDMEHTLLKSIALPIPEGFYLADIQYVSENLFNEDNLVELVYIYSKYVPTTLSYYYTFEAQLINENGDVQLTLPGVGFTEVIQTSSQELKFLAYEYNYSVIPYLTKTLVYSLPGGSTKATSGVLAPARLGNAYPNPASQLVHIPVHLPEGSGPGTLVITDLQGRDVWNYPVTGSNGQVVFPGGNLSPGTYLYHIRTGNTRTETGKVVIK